jgi:F-type H+-transporting ATPase subunit b
MKPPKLNWWFGILAGLFFASAPAQAQMGTDHEGHAEHAEHAADAHDGGEHEDAHGTGEINLFHGFFGEREGVAPSLAWRPIGMPPPLAANVLNTALLFFLIYYFGKKPVADALKKRKERIVAGMEEAAKMREEASRQLKEYEAKLERIDQEIERVRADMRAAAEAERKRILADADERRTRMQREAQLLVEQELKAAHEQLLHETVRSAVRSAEEILAKDLGRADHERLATEYLDIVGGSANAFGGRA